jgi:hypothetical protein
MEQQQQYVRHDHIIGCGDRRIICAVYSADQLYTWYGMFPVSDGDSEPGAIADSRPHNVVRGSDGGVEQRNDGGNVEQQ